MSERPIINPNITNNPDYSRLSHAEEKVMRFMSNWDERPVTSEVKDLVINHCLTSMTVLDYATKHGIVIPDMQETLIELNTLLPFANNMADSIARRHPNDNVIFLGRDGEVLADAYLTKYDGVFPKQVATLMPGSVDLWYNIKEKMIGVQDKELIKKFLATYGITEEAVRSGKTFIVVDSGFYGTVGEYIRTVVSELFSIPYSIVEDQFPTELANRWEDTWANNTTQIMSHQHEAYDKDYTKRHFPRSTYAARGQPTDGPTANFDHILAVAMQIAPHFHSTFQLVIERDGRVIAVPDRQTPNAKTFSPLKDDLRINASYVHPAAALITQILTIQYMLQREKVTATDSQNPY